MENTLTVKNEVLINAPAQKVWDALTKPEETKKYMYGCETVSDWQPGSELLWQGEYEGKKMVFVKGKVVRIEPSKYLEYTTIDPNSTKYADMPENYLTVTYTLEAQDGHTRLTVTQGDYTKVPDGGQRYNEAIGAGGWDNILTTIKAQVEAV